MRILRPEHRTLFLRREASPAELLWLCRLARRHGATLCDVMADSGPVLFVDAPAAKLGPAIAMLCQILEGFGLLADPLNEAKRRA